MKKLFFTAALVLVCAAPAADAQQNYQHCTPYWTGQYWTQNCVPMPGPSRNQIMQQNGVDPYKYPRMEYNNPPPLKNPFEWMSEED